MGSIEWIRDHIRAGMLSNLSDDEFEKVRAWVAQEELQRAAVRQDNSSRELLVRLNLTAPEGRTAMRLAEAMRKRLPFSIATFSRRYGRHSHHLWVEPNFDVRIYQRCDYKSSTPDWLHDLSLHIEGPTCSKCAPTDMESVMSTRMHYGNTAYDNLVVLAVDPKSP